jgi:hypothetical protein
MNIITPRACVRDKVIGSVRLSVRPSVRHHKNRHNVIWTSIGIWANYNYNQSVKVVDKLASLCFESFGKAHKDRKCHWPRLSTLPTMHVLSAHAHNLPQYIGKDRQLQALQLAINVHVGHVLYRAVVIIVMNHTNSYYTQHTCMYRVYHGVEDSTWFIHWGPCINHIGTDTEWYIRLVPCLTTHLRPL